MKARSRKVHDHNRGQVISSKLEKYQSAVDSRAQMSSPESTREPSQPEEVADEADERAARRKHAQEAIETSKLETAAAKAADDAAAAKIASDLGLEVAGGFQQTQAEIEKAAIQREMERRKDIKKKYKLMVKNEPTTMWRENKNMTLNDRPSWIMSNADNRRRQYETMCADHAKVKSKRHRRAKKEAKMLKKQMEEGFCFEQLVVRDHVRRKPTPGRMIKCIDQAHRKECRNCCFDESGEFIVSCGMDKAVKVWAVHSCKLIAELYAHRVGVTSIDVRGTVTVPLSKVHTLRPSMQQDLKNQGNKGNKARDDFLVLSCDANGMLMLWEGVEDPLPALTVRAHDVTIHDCHFSPDGQWLLTCSEDRSLRIFDGWSGAMLFQFQGHQGAVTTCAWSPNGNTFVSGGDFEDPTIRLWDAVNAVILMYFNEDHDEEAIAKQKEDYVSSSSSSEDEEEEKEAGNKRTSKPLPSSSSPVKRTKEQEERDERKLQRKRPDKRSGRKKAMELFERKVNEGLGIQWMTRTTMLLLCEAYLIVGDPQVGMALFDEMIKRKYRATSSLMELIWLFMKSDLHYINLRDQQKRIEYGTFDQPWVAPKMDTGEGPSGSHAIDVAWSEQVLLTTKGKPHYVSGEIQSGRGGGGSGGSGGNDKQKSKNSSKKTTKNLKTNQPFVVADDMLIGTKRSIPWQRGHEKWGVTELIRALRGDNRSFGFQTTTVQVFSQNKETKENTTGAASDDEVGEEVDKEEADHKNEEDDEEASSSSSVAMPMYEDIVVRYVRPMSAPTSRDISSSRRHLYDAVTNSSMYKTTKKDQKKKNRWTWNNANNDHHANANTNPQELPSQQIGTVAEMNEDKKVNEGEKTVDEEKNMDEEIESIDATTLSPPVVAVVAKTIQPMDLKHLFKSMATHVVQSAFDVAVSRIEYVQVDHMPEIIALREEQRRNDLLRMGIDPDIELKEKKKRLKIFKRLHKSLNISQHSTLERIQQVYNRLVVDVPMDTQLSQEGRLYVMMEHLGTNNNPITEDQDARVVEATRKRYMRQWRQIGQVKKHLKTKIKKMDAVLRKLSGVAPWRTDVNPNGANGQSTFLMSTFDHQFGKGHSDWINGIHFCNNGQHVVTASSDKTVRVWNPTTGDQIAILKGFPGWVNSIEVSGDQEWLVATSDHIISVWNFREVIERSEQKKREAVVRVEQMNEIESLKMKEKERREMEIQKERAESKKNKKKHNSNKDHYDMGKKRAQATKSSPYVIKIKQMEKSMKKL